MEGFREKMRRHMLLLTVCLLIAALFWMYHLIWQDGEDIAVSELLAEGDPQVFADIGFLCSISEQSTAQPAFVQQIEFGGENLDRLQTRQRLLTARQAAYLPRQDNSISQFFNGSKYIYHIGSGAAYPAAQGQYMQIRRNARDYAGSAEIIHLPVETTIPGRGYNAWEAIYSMAVSPIVELEQCQYLVTPADNRFNGKASIYRINRWKKEGGQKQVDYDIVTAEENDLYEILAYIELEEKTDIAGLFLHGQTLVVIGAEYKTAVDEQGREMLAGDNLFINRYDLDGRMIDSIRQHANFMRLQNACLQADTLTLITNGEKQLANVFLLGDEITYWNCVDLEFDASSFNFLSHRPFSFRVINDKLYMAAAVDLRPQLMEDQYTIKYADGTILKSGYPAWSRSAVKLAAYAQDGSALYQGYIDVDLNQDLYYKQNPAYNAMSEPSLPERTIVNLTIESLNDANPGGSYD